MSSKSPGTLTLTSFARVSALPAFEARFTAFAQNWCSVLHACEAIIPPSQGVPCPTRLKRLKKSYTSASIPQTAFLCTWIKLVSVLRQSPRFHFRESWSFFHFFSALGLTSTFWQRVATGQMSQRGPIGRQTCWPCSTISVLIRFQYWPGSLPRSTISV